MTAAYLQMSQRREQMLLSHVAEGRDAGAAPAGRCTADHTLLDRAYMHCDALTAASSRNFYLASGLLPRPKRRAIRALYAFCRVCDTIVDCPRQAIVECPQHVAVACSRRAATDSAQDNAESVLAAWRRAVTALVPSMTTDPILPETSALVPATGDLVALAWIDTRCRYQIPPCYAEQLIDGVARDLYPARYATFADLAAYAYGVASTVGLMSMHIIGYAGAAAVPYAIKLGMALQLTNILRDVGEDWRAGRVYLPQDELTAFGLTEADLALGQVDARWRAFMRFQIGRTRGLYAEAWPGIALLHKDGRLAIAAAGAFYRAILDDIEAHDYDVFGRRAHVSTVGKLRRLPGLWWSTWRM